MILQPIEDYEDFVKYDAHDILDKVERNEYHTFKKFRKDLGELSIGFQRLIEHRQEIYRMTNVRLI
jgi:hypothetical protein